MKKTTIPSGNPQVGGGSSREENFGSDIKIERIRQKGKWGAESSKFHEVGSPEKSLCLGKLGKGVETVEEELGILLF